MAFTCEQFHLEPLVRCCRETQSQRRKSSNSANRIYSRLSLSGLGFVFFCFLLKKKRSCFLTINLVYTMGLCSCYLIFTC